MKKQDNARNEDSSEQELSLTKQQYTTAKDLYNLGVKLGHFRTVGPWHSVDADYLERMSDRLAIPTRRPCSRGHIEGAWFSQDRRNFSNFQRPKTSYEILRDRRSPGSKSPESHYSLPLLRNRKEMNRKEVGSPNQSVSSNELNSITQRVSRPTVSSQGGKTIAEKFENKDYVYGSRTVDSLDEMDGIIGRISRSTVASTGGAGKQRKYTDFVYGDKTVNEDEFKEIIARLTKPTISSEGGLPIAKKDFTYIPVRITKMNPNIPKLKRIQTVLTERRTVPDEKLDEIVARLTKLTPAYKAKFAINPHVWVDDAPRGPAFYKKEVAA